MTIKINNTGIKIRPSNVDNHQACQYQWAKVFLEGVITIPNARAAIGTAIHKGCEEMWLEAIRDKKKAPNISMMQDASMEAFKEAGKGGLAYDDNESHTTAEKEILGGNKCFIEDIVPWLEIPTAVEKFLSVDIPNHPIVNSIGGTIDYITPTVIDDVKTSKRKPIPANYKTQQSIYRWLAEQNGYKIKQNRIQGIVLKKEPAGHILELEPDIEGAKYQVNSILAVTEIASQDIVPMEVLFRPNTKYYLCSKKYCSLHGSCPATKRHTPKATPLI